LVLGHIFDLKLRPCIVVVGIFAMVLERTYILEGVACTIVVEVVEEALAFDIEVVEDTFGLEEADIFGLEEADIFGPGVEDIFGLEEGGIFCLAKEDTFGPGVEDTFVPGVEDICFVN
jgi:hypothetical protein